MASPDGTGKKRRKKKKKRRKKAQVCGSVYVDLSCCRYQILRIALKKLGWEVTIDDSEPWDLLWTDATIAEDKLMTLKQGQKINHFVGMLEICRKKALARNLSTMHKNSPSVYNFFPRAYILPNQLPQFLNRLDSPKLQTYILKPDTGSQGRGVALVQSQEEVKNAMKGLHGADFVAQKYITKPMLINGYKFDLRIYVLILCCDPLRLYFYREGLARFCTEKYMKPDSKNLKVSCMHLTNYSLNKASSKFEFNSSAEEVNKGNKWTLTALYEALAEHGYDTNELEVQIKRMVVLTIIAIVPVLAHKYKSCLSGDNDGRSCFELLGLDVLVDENCKPWLLEVNHSPSFSIDTPLDYMVKDALILDTLRLINMEPRKLSDCRVGNCKNDKGCHFLSKSPKLSKAAPVYADYEAKNIGNFVRIYPPGDTNLQMFYDRCLLKAVELFNNSLNLKAKRVTSRIEVEKKQEELQKQAAKKEKKIRLEVQRKAREVAKTVALKGQFVHQVEAMKVPNETFERVLCERTPRKELTESMNMYAKDLVDPFGEVSEMKASAVTPLKIVGRDKPISRPPILISPIRTAQKTRTCDGLSMNLGDNPLTIRGYVKNITETVPLAGSRLLRQQRQSFALRNTLPT